MIERFWDRFWDNENKESAGMIHIRSEREIDRIRESCLLVVDTFNMIGQSIGEGVVTADLDHAIEEHIKKLGGCPAFKGYRMGKVKKVFPASSCISIDHVVVHGIPGNRRLMPGEIVSVDVGIEYQGYFGDAAKTYAIGKVDAERERLMQVTWDSLYKGIAQAVAGNRLSDISHAIQTYVEAARFSVVRDLVGHGVGKKLHEEPQIPNYGPPNKGARLRTGMVLAIEPMVNAGTAEVKTEKDKWTVITKDKLPSAHFEHTVVVREGQAEILTMGL
ncbi:MAG: type I methionyl aminopeptidase [bacterium]